MITTAFHGTPIGNVPSILREGVKAGGSAHPVAFTESSKPGLVYLTTDHDEAHRFAEGAGHHLFGRSPLARPAILEVAIPPVAPIHPDENYPRTGRHFAYHGDVPPTWIRAVRVLSSRGWVRRKMEDLAA
jgi:hypothetical protein